MKITNIEFTDEEVAALYVKAGMELYNQEYSRQEAQAYISKLTPQNVLRLALGAPFKVRQRGGKRANSGPQKRKRESGGEK